MSQNQLYLGSPFALYAQSQSLILLLLLHFSIFLVEILKLASQLNLAAILFIGFLNFEFGAILGLFSGKFRQNSTKFEIQKFVNRIAAKFSWKANFKISTEKCRSSSNISDWDWAKSAKEDTADVVTFLRVFGHRIQIFRDI